MARRAEPRDRQGFGTDDQRPLGANPGDGPEQPGLGNRGGDLRDVSIDRANERPESGNHAQMAPHERALLEPEVRPGLRSDPLSPGPRQQAAALEMQPSQV